MLRLQAPLPERYTHASTAELEGWIGDARTTLGDSVFILGHHYQRDEVMRWADARGDSFRLSVLSQEHPEATSIVFCGVHFMAESADILTGDHQHVLLPDLNAGCSMADMADIDQVEEAWEELGRATDLDRLVPITYMNSSAALKAFVGEHGGAVCTSTNARAVLDWAFRAEADGGAGGRQVLFFPDQHLGRNTGYAMGFTEADMRVWNPRLDLGGLTDVEAKDTTFLLWKGHCSVHQRFRPSQVEAARAEWAIPKLMAPVAPPSTRISARRLELANRWFERHGPPVIFVSRLIPLVRAVLSADKSAALDWNTVATIDPRTAFDVWWVESELVAQN